MPLDDDLIPTQEEEYSIAPSGSGLKRGGGASPVDREDSIFGRGTAKAVMLIGEGQMEGFPGGDFRNHVYLDNTPLKFPAAARPNFKNVSVRYRSGIPLQGGIPGFTNKQARDTGVNVVVTKKGGAVTRSIINSTLDVIRVNLVIQTFWNTGKDIKKNEVRFRIWTKQGTAGWKIRRTIELDERAQQGVPLSYDIPVNNQNGTVSSFQIRLEKLSEDSTSSSRPNTIQWISYSEIVEDKIGYAHTAIAAIQIDSENFQSMPNVTLNQHGIRGLLIPNGATVRADRSLNLSAVTWTGATTTTTQAIADLFPTILNELTNPRINPEPYSLAEINLNDLYEICQWNNTLITHPDGVQRPRHRMVNYISEKFSGLELLEQLLSGCFANFYEADGQLRFWQDRSNLSITQSFSNSKVAEGIFDYPETLDQYRYNVCNVTWWNPAIADFDDEKYEDRADIKLRGRKEISVTAIGCENRYQAQLYAKAIVVTSQLEYRTCQFQAHPQAILCRPGQVIKVYDENYAQVRNSGLIRSVSGTTFTLDAPVVAVAGDTFSYLTSAGAIESRTVQSVNTTNATVTVTAAPSSVMLDEIWTIERPTVNAQFFRVQSVTPTEDDRLVEVVGINYVSNKWSVIEQDAVPYIPPTRSTFVLEAQSVKNLNAVLLEVDSGGFDSNPNLFTIQANWLPADQDGYTLRFVAEFRVAEGEWGERQEIPKNVAEARWTGKALGRYQVRVAAVDIYGKISAWVVSPEINNTVTAIVSTTQFVILRIPCTNVSMLSIAMQNNGPNALNAFGVFYKTHPSAADYKLLSFGAEMVSTIAGTSRNAALVNNITLPYRYATSNPNTLVFGAACRFAIDVNGYTEIALYGQTATGTAQLKIWSKALPAYTRFAQ